MISYIHLNCVLKCHLECREWIRLTYISGTKPIYIAEKELNYLAMWVTAEQTVSDRVVRKLILAPHNVHLQQTQSGLIMWSCPQGGGQDSKLITQIRQSHQPQFLIFFCVFVHVFTLLFDRHSSALFWCEPYLLHDILHLFFWTIATGYFLVCKILRRLIYDRISIFS